MESPKADVLLEHLREYVQEQGGELAPGWHCEVKTRNSGTSAGTSDAYYFNPAGQRFRSRQEIMRHLELAARQSKKISREEAVANAKATAEQLGKQLPISLDNGVTVV
ncbi:MAG: methyl- -binding domain 2, partial [Trebouxia sp. A1-2]